MMSTTCLVRGAVFAFSLFLVAYCGGLFFLPPCFLLWQLPFCGKLARRANDFIITLWLRLVPALLEVIFGVKIKICGDLNPLTGPCLIILNHRTRFDWLFLWCFLMRLGDLRTHKIILKKSLKRIPAFGWAMQAAHFLFISRDWDKDEQYLSNHLSYFSSMDYPLQLLIFPEGTDLSDSNKEKSQKYAAKNSLQKYDYVLHPRTKGFVHCISEMRKFNTAPTIINMSVGYVGSMPQNERDLAFGKWPDEIHFFSEHIPSSKCPNGKKQLEEWLNKMWESKEEQLKEFYSKNRFDAPYMRPGVVAEAKTEMKYLLAFWVMFFGWFGYSLATSYFYWWYLPLWTVFYVLFNFLSDGQEEMVARSRNRSQKR